MRTLKVFSRVIVLAALMSALGYAQVPECQILGTVTDASGAVVAGAAVVLENQLTGIKQDTATNESGGFIFSYLNPGTYRVSVEVPGFRAAVYSDIRVHVTEKRRIDVVLQVGELTSTIEVTGGAGASPLDTDSARIGAVVSEREVVDLPLNGREFSQYADAATLAAYGDLFVTADKTDLPINTLAYGDHNNFTPRVGFAWRPFERGDFVVRGGYGLFNVLEWSNASPWTAGGKPYGTGGGTFSNSRPAPSVTIADPFASGVAAPPVPSPNFRDPNMRDGRMHMLTLGIEARLPPVILPMSASLPHLDSVIWSELAPIAAAAGN